jgi:dihydrofolate synthase/folylpolyglutamate synthase
MSYSETINYLYSLQKFGLKLGLSNTERLLKALGNPEKDFLSIHVAGTNGKGSTSRIIAILLEGLGRRTGLFTSPHLVRFTERIRVNSEEISEDDVVRLTEYIKGIVPEDIKPTFFEFVTALAFKYFSEKKIDIGVIEVGMGGRLDATNVIRPQVSVITSISMDHREFLGNTIEDIAKEKAGIIKKGVPVVSSLQEKPAMEVIARKASEEASPLYIYGRDFTGRLKDLSVKGVVFDYEDEEITLKDLFLPLTGAHQLENACLAIKSVLVGGSNSPFNSPSYGKRGYGGVKGAIMLEPLFKKSLNNLSWPGRLELLLKDNIHYLFDGAHNPQAVRSLQRAIQEIYLRSYKRVILVLGIMADKDIEDMLEPLMEISDIIIATSPDYKRAIDPQRLASMIKKVRGDTKKPCEVFSKPDIASAMELAKGLYRKGDLVVITGSFYTVGEAKVVLGERESLRTLREEYTNRLKD